MISFLEKHRKLCLALLWTAVVLASIKSIFTDTGFDNAYTVAMSFRHLKGDGMFRQMWEPHQTSIFFTDFFMWLYRFLVPSYTGVMIYLQIVGTAFHAVIGFLLYRLLKTIAGSDVAQLAAAFFILFRAKQTPFPEYANLQIGFSVLLFLCMVSFVREQEKRRYLCFAAFFLCLEVLSYPSCLLVYFPAVLILFFRTKERWKNIGLFTGVCALFGGIYTGYFVCKAGPAAFIRNLRNIFYADPHSDGAVVSVWNYFYGVIVAISWLVLCGAFTWLLMWALRRLLKRTVDFFAVYGMVLFVSELALLFLQKKTGLDWTCTFYILPALLMALSCSCYKDMDELEKTVWLAGNLFALGAFLATCLLTALGLITMVPYMVLGGVVSLAALRHRKKQIWTFLFFVCGLVVMHRGLVIWGYANQKGIYLVHEADTIVRSGPCLGVICDYNTYHRLAFDAEDHNQFITSEDSLLLVGDWLVDSMEFLLTDADISNYSTIDVPAYNELLLEYLELYPEKEPTVVAVSMSSNAMLMQDASWIMRWVNENYDPVGEGRNWRYYRAKEGQDTSEETESAR
ncbi:MAG: glucosyltransferase domain-containing protein [Roseburia sp.]|nr:glucosyltransferase domain-containing protein [Roseburia sp.]MCM1096768.1 glucosyltransferase domain-containing protein [Ruminococcus flavefaciens]